MSSSLVVQEEVEGEDLAHAVDDEMAATEKAVNDAVDRIQEMLKRTRETDKGQKLEVNSSILEACTTLMEVCFVHRGTAVTMDPMSAVNVDTFSIISQSEMYCVYSHN